MGFNSGFKGLTDFVIRDFMDFDALSTVHSTYSKISLKMALQLGRNM